MRIVASPDGVVSRIDRALWMTPPFDLAFASYTVIVIPTYLAAQVTVAIGTPDHGWTTIRPI